MTDRLTSPQLHICWGCGTDTNVHGRNCPTSPWYEPSAPTESYASMFRKEAARREAEAKRVRCPQDGVLCDTQRCMDKGGCAAPQGERKGPDSAAADERVFSYDTGGGYIASMTAPHVEKHFADLQARINALESDKAELVEALAEIAEAGAEPWGPNRPCVAIALKLIEKHGGARG